MDTVFAWTFAISASVVLCGVIMKVIDWILDKLYEKE